MNNLTIDNDSITPQRTQPALHLYIFFSVVIPGFRSIGYSFISGTSVDMIFVLQASYHFFPTHPSTLLYSYYLHLATGCFSKAFGSPTHSGRSDLGINTLGTQRVEEFDQGCILPEADSVLDGWDNGWVLFVFFWHSFRHTNFFIS